MKPVHTTIYIVVPQEIYDRETASLIIQGVRMAAIPVRETEKSFVASERRRELAYNKVTHKESLLAQRMIGRTPQEAQEKFLAEQRNRIAAARNEITHLQYKIEKYQQLIEFATTLEAE